MIDAHRVTAQGAASHGACLAAIYRLNCHPAHRRAPGTTRPLALMTRSFRIAGVAAALASGSLAAFACSSSTSPNGSVGSVKVTPATDSVAVGNTIALQATVIGPGGQVVSGQRVFWNTGDASIATVSDAGVVTGVSPGSATITASSEGHAGTATIVVQPPLAATVTVAPPAATLIVGDSVALSATVKDAQGNVITDAPVTWTTNKGAAASVSAAGLVKAVGAGTAIITATSGSASGSSTILVIPVL